MSDRNQFTEVELEWRRLYRSGKLPIDTEPVPNGFPERRQYHETSTGRQGFDPEYFDIQYHGQAH